MVFVEIENLRPAPTDAVPTQGLRLRARTFKTAKAGIKHWIEITIGGGLAKKLALALPSQKLRILFGSGDDAGKLMIATDQEKGQFPAKRDKTGRYRLSISGPSADGLFALDFPPFAVIEPEVVRAPGCPPACTFECSAEMLAVAD